MGEECHSIRPTECSSPSTATDSRCALAYPLHRNLRINFLLPMCNTSFLAFTDTIHDLLYVLKGFYLWNLEPSFGFSTVITSMEPVCLLLSG